VTGQREQTKALGDALGARIPASRRRWSRPRLGRDRRRRAPERRPRLRPALCPRPHPAGAADQGDAKLTEVAAALQPYAQAGVASRAALADSFPAVAKAALATTSPTDSFSERLLGKVRSIVSLRRVGDDVPGDSAEAKLARA